MDPFGSWTREAEARTFGAFSHDDPDLDGKGRLGSYMDNLFFSLPSVPLVPLLVFPRFLSRRLLDGQFHQRAASASPHPDIPSSLYLRVDRSIDPSVLPPGLYDNIYALDARPRIIWVDGPWDSVLDDKRRRQSGLFVQVFIYSLLYMFNSVQVQAEPSTG